MAGIYACKNFILNVVFGHIEPGVMHNAEVYLMIVTASIPFIAIYNGCVAFTIPNTLRAANDVKYCMVVASATMWIFRIFCSVVLGKWMGLGVFGVWVAMTLDWVFSCLLYTSPSPRD